MPHPRFLKLDAEKRRAILEAATAEFAENGFEGASYNRIIEVAGISKGAMYYYFDDKLDLYVTLLEDITDRALGGLGADSGMPEGVGFWDAMRAMSVKAWTFALEHPEMAALLKSVAAFPPRARREGRLGDLYRRWRQILRDMLAVGQAQGEVRTDRPLDLLVNIAEVLDEAIDLWLIDHIGELADDPVEEVVDMALDFWKRLLGPA